MNDTRTTLLILALSGLEGTRVSVPPAILSSYLARNPAAAPDWLSDKLGTPLAVWASAALALGELVGDKLPATPARTSPPQLIARVVFGSGLGTLLANAYEQPIWIGALGGAASAAATTFAVYYLRREFGRILHIPDVIPAVLEDAAVITASWKLLAALGEQQ